MDKLNDLKILVTGGAGFIGSNIVEFLLNNSVKYVRVLDNLSTGHFKNIQEFAEDDRFQFMLGDISNMEDCIKAVEGMDVVCHQAALGSVPRSMKIPLKTHNSNVNGFLNMLIASKDEGIKRFVYASSSSVYGDDKSLPKKENVTGTVISPYAATKYINEVYASTFNKCYGMETIGLRYFNIFGPKQDPEGVYAAVIPKFIKLLSSNRRVMINGDGSYSRDFTYVLNAVQANVNSMLTDNEDAYGRVINVGVGGNVTILELYNVICQHLDKNVKPIMGKTREGDIPHSKADISLGKELVGYEPSVEFEEGIGLTIEYFSENSGVSKSNRYLSLC